MRLTNKWQSLMLGKVVSALGLSVHVCALQAATADLSGGIWQPVNPPASLRTANGEPPPLLPAAQLVYEKNRNARQSGSLDFDTTERCLPPGLPRLLSMRTPFEFQIRPDQIAIFYQWDRLVRFVDITAAHGDSIGLSYEGDSIGKWEGGGLIVDSVNFRNDTILDDAGMPHSDALHVVERYQPGADGQSMTVSIRIEDPGVFSKPWETELHFRRNPAGRIRELTCVDRKDLHWGKIKQGVEQTHELAR